MDLQAPFYAIFGESIWVKCSSDLIPSRPVAEFDINGETIDTLQRQDRGCFSAALTKICSNKECNCSENGNRFGIRLHVNQNSRKLKITCSMKFIVKEPVYKTSMVTVEVLGK